MITEEQLKEMLESQNKLNELINPNWRTEQYSWKTAIWVECAELLDHYGWKWWKKQEPNLEQIKLELVDISHFILAQLIENDDDIDNIVKYEFATLKHCYDYLLPGSNYSAESDFICFVEQFCEEIFKHYDSLTLSYIIPMMKMINMDISELYFLFIPKNTLNIFRQLHGYKEGTYIKNWNGKEDNEVLMEIVNSLNPNDVNSKILFELLEKRYLEINQHV